MRLLSRSILAGLLVSASPLFAGLATAYQDATHLYLENDALKIAFLRTNGSLDGIIHKKSGVNVQPNTAQAQTTWLLYLRQPSGDVVFVSNTETSAFAATVETNSTEARLILTWKGLKPPGLARLPDVTVTAQVTVRTDSPLSFWSFEMEGPGTSSVSQIDYPLIRGIDKLGQSGNDDQLLMPTQKGRLYHNPTAYFTHVGGTYPSFGQTMQFMAYFDTTSGIYIASDDTQGYTKNFYWYQNTGPPGDFSLHSVSYPSPPSDTIKVPFHIIVGATQGDWYNAAEIYRSWAVQQPWAQQSRARKAPTWLHDVALSRQGWGYSYSVKTDQSYANFVEDIQRSDKNFGVAVMGQLIGWEKYGAFVEGDYFPPKEGWTSFDAMVQSLRPSKLWLLPSAFILDTNTDLYRSGSMNSSAMLDAMGKQQTTTGAGNNSGQWVFMDFTTEPWAQHVVDTYATLAAHGADLIQLDSSMNWGPIDCYNPAHAHPPGRTGNWQTVGWINLTNRIASAVSAANPSAALAAEQPAEIYLPYLSVSYTSGDDFFERNMPSPPSVEPVPLIEYVYHDSILFADLVPEPDATLDGNYFRLGVARDLTWGQFLNNQLFPHPHEADSASMAYMQSAITARTTYAKKFLVDGIMLPAPRLNVSTVAVSWRGPTQPVTGQFPSVQHSAWRAADGSVGIIMANITTNSVTFSLPVEYSRLGLPPGAAYTVQGTDGSTITALDSSLNKDSTYSIALKPTQILLVTLTPKAPQPQISVGGVVMHASSSTTVSPGSLFDIYGANLASNSVGAPKDLQVLPSTLGNVQVLVNGIPAPLLFAGPTQIVAQIPSSILIGTASVVAFRDGAASAAASVNVQQAAPTILTYGTNRAIVQNQDYSLNSSTNPAQTGSYAVAYLIGSGPVTPNITDGEPAAASPPSTETLNTTVTIGGTQVKVLFAGMAPGFVGLVQVNFQVPDLPTGDYPIQVSIGTAQSNTPTITVGQ